MRQVTTAVALLAFGLLGCGTIDNFAPEPQNPFAVIVPAGNQVQVTPHQYEIFGGVQNDVEYTRAICGCEFASPLLTMIAPDFLFSFIADTLTLPVTVSMTLYRLMRPSRRDSIPPDNAPLSVTGQIRHDASP